MDESSSEDEIWIPGTSAIITPGQELVGTQEISVTNVPPDKREIVYNVATTSISGDDTHDHVNFEFTITEFPRQINSYDLLQTGAGCSLQLPSEHTLFEIYGRRVTVSDVFNVLSWGKPTQAFLDALVLLLIERHETRLAVAANRHEFQLKFARNYRYFSTTDNNIVPHADGVSLNKIFAVHSLYNQHFFLALYDFTKNQVDIYDSSWHLGIMEDRDYLAKKTVRVINRTRGHAGGDNWRIIRRQKCSQFHEAHSGVPVVRFASNILVNKNAENFKMFADAIVFVQSITAEVLSMEPEGAKILSALTQEG